MTSLLTNKLYDKLDSDFLLYLTPELTVDHNITTVEKAYEYYINNDLPYNYNLNTVPEFIPDRNTFLQNFDYKVYTKFYSSNISNDIFIADEIRNDLFENDVERLSVIHYHRIGRGNYFFRHTNVDSNFNPYLYKVAHNITKDMTTAEAYYDYLDRKNSGNDSILIANINDLSYHIACNLTVSVDNLVVDDTLTVKENMVIQKNAYVMGNMITDSTGLAINGGTIMIDNTFGNTDYMFSQGRLSSNSLAFGNSELQYSSNETEGPFLTFEGANVGVTSNLFVSQSVLVGETLLYNPDYSLQTEKKIKVQGNDVLSDARLKTNIEMLDTKESLDRVSKLSVKLYEMIGMNGQSEGNRVAGLLAGQTKEIIPHAVSSNHGFVPITNDDEFLALTMNTLLLISDQKKEASSVVIGESYILFNLHTNLPSEPVTVVSIEYTRVIVNKPILNASHKYKVVRKAEKDVMCIDYTQVLCYLIGAIQEIKTKVDQLEFKH